MKRVLRSERDGRRAKFELRSLTRLETWSDHRTSRSTETETGAICLESDHEYAAVIRLLIMQQIYILRHYKKQEMKIILKKINK